MRSSVIRGKFTFGLGAGFEQIQFLLLCLLGFFLFEKCVERVVKVVVIWFVFLRVFGRVDGQVNLVLTIERFNEVDDSFCNRSWFLS